MTVAKLRAALEGAPDDMEVVIGYEGTFGTVADDDASILEEGLRGGTLNPGNGPPVFVIYGA